jgi:hypothetical protein
MSPESDGSAIDQLLANALLATSGEWVVGALGCKNAKISDEERRQELLQARMRGDIPLTALATVIRTFGFVLPRPRSGSTRAEIACPGCGTAIPVVVRSRRRVRAYWLMIALACVLAAGGLGFLYSWYSSWRPPDPKTRELAGYGVFYFGIPVALLVVGGFFLSLYFIIFDPFESRISIDSNKMPGSDHTLYSPKGK